MRPHVVRAFIATLALASLSLAACAEDGAGTAAGSDEASAGGDPAACGNEVSIDDLSDVGLAFDTGGRGDQSFNDSAVAGLDEAVAELDLSATELSPDAEGSNRADLLRQLADAGNNPIFAVGFGYAELLPRVAQEYPDTMFIIIDSDESDCANVKTINFREEQGSFLVGAAAALKTETGTVGMLAANDSELINRFYAGFQQGVAAADPDVEVLYTALAPGDPVGGYTDPQGARVAAEALYEQGADIVYHAAGSSGGGVFEAASATGNLAIGVDSDQYLTAGEEFQDVIITSMIKRVDSGVLESLRTIEETGTYESTSYDLAADGVGYSTTGGAIDDIVPQLEEFKQQIVDGDIEVSAEPTS